MTQDALSRSGALWNRSHLDLRSDETVAQIMDRGEVEAWRELYALARADSALRARVLRLARSVPMYLPRFWMAALAEPGEPVDYDAPRPSDPGSA